MVIEFPPQTGVGIHLAERVGFEPTVGCPITSFQDWLLKPLGHLSILCGAIRVDRPMAHQKEFESPTFRLGETIIPFF